jgi:hypothetical protein
MSAFTDFEKAVVAGVRALAKGALKDFGTQAQNDARSFLKQTKQDLRRWTSELRANELTQAEFADLVKGQKDLAELAALKQAGLALAARQRFRDGLMKLVVDTAFKTFLP